MKRIFVFSLLSCTLLVACGPNEEVVRGERVGHHRYGDRGDEALVTEPTPTPVPLTAPEPVVNEVKPTPPPTPTPAPPKREGLLYGKPVPGKPGFVYSPYNPDGGLIDVRNYPPSTAVKDPYAPGKILLVP